jgi:hypothetical protein
VLRLLAIASLLLLAPFWASAQEAPPTQVLITNATVLADYDENIKVVLKDGEVIKNDL